MVNIVQYNNDTENVLRAPTKGISIKDIPTKHIQSTIDRMKTALKSQDDGIAIAAPQIGESLRIFIISGKVFAPQNPDNPDISVDKKEYPDMVFINPKIIKTSRKIDKIEEGCLSVRWLYGKVDRFEKATIKAYNEKGELIERGGSGLLAQIFQHETDHLDGILFIDKAEDITEYEPEHL